MTHARPNVAGLALDPQTRCAHYHSALDVVAIEMKCCGIFYACKDCHEALAGHPLLAWPRAEWNALAVMCGACATQMTISQYLACENTCPNCSRSFNPRCSDHHAAYFDCAPYGAPLGMTEG